MSFNRKNLSFVIVVATIFLGVRPASAIVYSYENTTSGALANPSSNNGGNCSARTNYIDRTFVVGDSFTVQQHRRRPQR